MIIEKGAISGAITNADSPEAVLHAYKYYEYIRHIKNDIHNIAKNTEFTEDQIRIVKDYIFYSEHNLDIGYARFTPDFYMAQSWRRLAFEPENILPHDIMLIKHELYEMSLVVQGYEQHFAHDKANAEGYNYQQMCKEYYNNLNIKQKYKKVTNKNIEEENYNIER